MMISVVIPLYNKENQIEKTLQSVFNQSFTDYEIVIVNDGSTDRSAEFVEAIDDPRIRLIHQQNAGVSAARNRGIEEAKGDYIAFLDADDEWKPDYLATQASMIEKYPECDVFATNYEFRNEKGETKPTILRKVKIEGEDGIMDNYFEVASCSDHPLWTSAVVASKTCLKKIEGFPVGCTSGEDLLTWARLAAKNKVAFTKSAKAVYYTPTTGPTGIVPIDLKSTKDFVGNNIIKLSHETKRKDIKIYASYWYKMRGVINLNRLNRWAAAKCAFKSIKLYPFLYKSWAILSLSIFPSKLIKRIFKK